MNNLLASISFALAALLSLTVATSVAYAQTAPSAEMRQACGADARALCSSVTPGGGRIKQCMMSNFDKLSDGCKAAIKSSQGAK